MNIELKNCYFLVELGGSFGRGRPMNNEQANEFRLLINERWRINRRIFVLKCYTFVYGYLEYDRRLIFIGAAT